MKFNTIYKILNVFLLLLMLVILIPIFHMLVSNTNKYENLYAKVKFNLIDTQTKYNVTIDKDILETIRSGNNTIFLRHSDDDTKDRDPYFDSLSIISDFNSINLSAEGVAFIVTSSVLNSLGVDPKAAAYSSKVFG